MIEAIKTENLKPHPNNEEMWKGLEVEKLIEMIQLSGQITPLLVSRRENGDQFVLGGNRRLKVAVEIGWKELECRVLDGLAEEQERDHLLWDNFGNRTFNAESQLKAAIYLMQTMSGTQKQQIEALSKKTGYSIPKCKQIFATASKIQKAAAAAGEDGESVQNKAFKNAALHGLRSKTVGRTIKTESEKSIGTTAKSSDFQVTRITASRCPRCSELEAELAELHEMQFDPEQEQLQKELADTKAELETIKAKSQKQSRRMLCVLESFKSMNPAWASVLAYMDQPIDLGKMRAYLDQYRETKPEHNEKMKLQINDDNPPQIIYELFRPFLGQDELQQLD